MIREPSLAVVGVLGYFAFALFAPVNLGGGAFGISFWMLPLIAIHLWPRGAPVGLSAGLILVAGLLIDLWTGLPAGTSPLIALVWWAMTRPDNRDEDAVESTMWITFAVGIGIVVFATVLVAGRGGADVVSSTVMDGLLAVLAFPLGFRILRSARLAARDRGQGDAFP